MASSSRPLRVNQLTLFIGRDDFIHILAEAKQYLIIVKDNTIVRVVWLPSFKGCQPQYCDHLTDDGVVTLLNYIEVRLVV
ncbi:hypothetical protein CHS0354_016811 [Potamilus streckersoni]|uniref:Uncharacterized protein n=1 Tax=Potamilus streckersoni TaxID=2493646 RepID=A0AAE0T3M8_9BIVA|nr:hypothetical protein CHS0354_016811 [Potamilus streckersoni]